MPEQTLGGIPLGLGMVMNLINFLNFHVKYVIIKISQKLHVRISIGRCPFRSECTNCIHGHAWRVCCSLIAPSCTQYLE